MTTGGVEQRPTAEMGTERNGTMLSDFRKEAERFRDIDDAALASIEADDAEAYLVKHNRWPDGLSVRAWNELMSRGKVKPAAGVTYMPPRP
jgi:hypothetical protein